MTFATGVCKGQIAASAITGRLTGAIPANSQQIYVLCGTGAVAAGRNPNINTYSDLASWAVYQFDHYVTLSQITTNTLNDTVLLTVVIEPEFSDTNYKIDEMVVIAPLTNTSVSPHITLLYATFNPINLIGGDTIQITANLVIN